MTSYEWFTIILFIGFVGLSIHIFREKNQHMAKLHTALQKARLEIHQLEEDHRQKEIQREKTEEKLRSYLQLLDALINTMSNPVCFKDEHGIFQGCNQVFAQQVLGLTRDRIIGKRSQDLPEQIPPDLAALYHCQEMVMLGKGDFHAFEAQVQCADGSRRDFLFSLAPIQNHKGNSIGTVAVLSDLTEKNRGVQDRLVKEKLEIVLETAGGVCHEFNQPLQALSGNLEILAVTVNASSEALGYIEKALEQIERMRTITDKLQGITRYETLAYVGSTKIIDIHRSSQHPVHEKKNEVFSNTET
jgi:PAS domain S-box-containing protein